MLSLPELKKAAATAVRTAIQLLVQKAQFFPQQQEQQLIF